MTQVGEPVLVGTVTDKKPKALALAVMSITFGSGIKLFEVAKGGAENEIPASGTPHWTYKAIHPAVYVREGGKGETKDLLVQVQWSQQGHDGSAKLEGRTRDGSIVIEGDFDLSGARGKADVKCTFSKRPDKVTNHGSGVVLRWTVTAGGDKVGVAGGSPLRLYFVDAKPKPIGWSYKAHYVKVVDWATRWAAGKAGEKDVLAALWSKFCDGKGAHVPHVTGFAYWKTGNPIQNLKELVQPDGGVHKRGWSCRAIAHTFMECLALHGIQCLEVVPETPSGTYMFLVKNWDVAASPLPNWSSQPDRYYAGTWIQSDSPPLNRPVLTSLKQDHGAPKPPPPPLKIDMRKRSGVPAQGQPLAPLGFSNHWIVEVGGKLYDTSYGGVHSNSMTAYATASLSGWLIDVLADTKASSGSWLAKKKASMAWQAHAVAKHTLDRSDGASN